MTAPTNRVTPPRAARRLPALAGVRWPWSIPAEIPTTSAMRWRRTREWSRIYSSPPPPCRPPCRRSLRLPQGDRSRLPPCRSPTHPFSRPQTRSTWHSYKLPKTTASPNHPSFPNPRSPPSNPHSLSTPASSVTTPPRTLFL
jgi:hypothetical protein